VKVPIALLAAALCAGAADLFTAVRNDDLAALRAAIAAKADLNARDRRGATPLMHAAAFGSLEAMKLLVEAGADVNARSAFDVTALIWGAGDPAKVRLLLEGGADLKAVTKMRRTALHVAAATVGASESVRLLLARGADPGASDSQGATPLIAAADNHDQASIRLLVEAGAGVNARNQGGFTPLIGAATNGNLEAVRLLLAKGAAVDAGNSGGGRVKNGAIALRNVTPLMWAAPFAPREMIATLLDAGAKADLVEGRGMTALMLAVATERPDIGALRLLIARGGAINAKDQNGETALDWARKHRHPEVLDLLVRAGAREGAPFTAPRPPEKAWTSDPRAAAEKSLGLLQKTSKTFFVEGGCVGCHHHAFTAMATAAARSHGLRADAAAARELLAQSRAQAASWQEILLQMMDLPGDIDQAQYALLTLCAYEHPADAATDALVFYVAGLQRADGSWAQGYVSRPPIEESNIQRTALGISVLRHYGWPGRKSEFDRRVTRARDYLAKSRPFTTDDYAMRALGLHWAGASRGAVAEAGRRLAALQRADGGWGQNPRLASDAFATGEALHALYETGVLKPSGAAYRRGVAFLLRTQYPDGSWYVRSRAPKFQPYFESGFPFGHDQWVSASATGWAAAALAHATRE
jgi:ankyrin repeat protein